MRQVTKHETDDGVLYDTENEALCAEQAKEMAKELREMHGAYGKCTVEDAVDWFTRTYDFTRRPGK